MLSRAGCSKCTQHEQDVRDGHQTIIVKVTVATGGAAEVGKQKEDIVDANGSVIVQVAEAVACGLEAAAQGARVPTMQVRIHMVALLVHRHAIVGPFVTWIEITRAAEAGLTHGPAPPVDHVLKLVFPQRKFQSGRPHKISIGVLEGVATCAPPVEVPRDIDDVTGGQHHA